MPDPIEKWIGVRIECRMILLIVCDPTMIVGADAHRQIITAMIGDMVQFHHLPICFSAHSANRVVRAELVQPGLPLRFASEVDGIIVIHGIFLSNDEPVNVMEHLAPGSG